MDDTTTEQSQDKQAPSGVGLALSGGGFRATLFHVGSLWRLNELGWLNKLTEVTSVSGGSIAAAHLALRWENLTFRNGIASNFAECFAAPLQEFCARSCDVGVIIRGILDPFSHPARKLARHYRRNLFGDATLADLPGTAGPRFTIYATSLQTGAGVQISRDGLSDYHLGLYADTGVDIGTAVAASSGFPPVLCPLELRLDPAKWRSRVSSDRGPLAKTMLLGDGGIYDNLGLERLWKRKKVATLLVSDAGAPFVPLERSFWLRWSQLARTKRTIDVMMAQVRAQRVQTLLSKLRRKRLAGAYWGIATDIDEYQPESVGLLPALIKQSPRVAALAKLRTRLNPFTAQEQAALINWGYALTDAAMRRYVLACDTDPPPALPFHK